jgi:hypothetical protein
MVVEKKEKQISIADMDIKSMTRYFGKFTNLQTFWGPVL